MCSSATVTCTPRDQQSSDRWPCRSHEALSSQAPCPPSRFCPAAVGSQPWPRPHASSAGTAAASPEVTRRGAILHPVRFSLLALHSKSGSLFPGLRSPTSHVTGSGLSLGPRPPSTSREDLGCSHLWSTRGSRSGVPHLDGAAGLPCWWLPWRAARTPHSEDPQTKPVPQPRRQGVWPKAAEAGTEARAQSEAGTALQDDGQFLGAAAAHHVKNHPQ